MRRSSLSRTVAVSLLVFVSVVAGVVPVAPASARNKKKSHVVCRQTSRQHKSRSAHSRKTCRPAAKKPAETRHGSPVGRTKITSHPGTTKTSQSGSTSGWGAGSAPVPAGKQPAPSVAVNVPADTDGSIPVFGATSLWNHTVPANAPLSPSSAAIAAYLNGFVNTSIAQGTGPWINTTNYSTPIYTVPANQPTVPVMVDWNPPSLDQAFAAVPIPSNAVPAAGSDEQMVIYQPSTDRMWEMWQMRQDASGLWHAGWGGRMLQVSTDPGYYRNVSGPNGTMLEQSSWGATASSLPLAAGLITLDDLASGQINHAIAMMVPKAAAKVFYCPAQRTDGYDTSANAIPEGAHFRLDPTLDLSQLHMPTITRMIAVAAQKYGLIVNDQTGATVGFRAQDPSPLMRAGAANPYATYFANPATGSYMYPTQFLASFPWSHLQLLAPPTTCS
jgi:hypothetical protein